MQGDAEKLARHCARQHVNEFDEMVENEGFLRWGRLPSYSKYVNFREYMADKNIGLIVVPGYIYKKAGRPYCDKNHVQAEQIISDERPT